MSASPRQTEVYQKTPNLVVTFGKRMFYNHDKAAMTLSNSKARNLKLGLQQKTTHTMAQKAKQSNNQQIKTITHPLQHINKKDDQTIKRKPCSEEQKILFKDISKNFLIMKTPTKKMANENKKIK